MHWHEKLAEELDSKQLEPVARIQTDKKEISRRRRLQEARADYFLIMENAGITDYWRD